MNISYPKHIKAYKEPTMQNYPMIVRSFFLFFFCIVLSACTGLATAQPITQTPQIREQITAEIRTPTKTPATLKPSPAYTSTVKPTETSTSTSHSSDTPAVSQRTDIPTATPQTMSTETSALALEATEIANFSPNCDGYDLKDLNDFYT